MVSCASPSFARFCAARARKPGHGIVGAVVALLTSVCRCTQTTESGDKWPHNSCYAIHAVCIANSALTHVMQCLPCWGEATCCHVNAACPGETAQDQPWLLLREATCCACGSRGHERTILDLAASLRLFLGRFTMRAMQARAPCFAGALSYPNPVAVHVPAVAIVQGPHPAQEQVAPGHADAGDQRAPHDAHDDAHDRADRRAPAAAAGCLHAPDCAP